VSRIAARFATLKARERTALIPFVTAGDPSPAVTVPVMHAMVEAGADLIELGVPFSDPMADGPVIQRASERALAAGMSFAKVLDIVREFRSRDEETPVVLMGYLNPLEAVGYAQAAERAAAAGVDGFITVDLPPEEAEELVREVRANGIDPIFLVAPTSTDERIALICSKASGFVYYVSLKGVTGSANLDVDEVGERVARIRRVTDLPVGVGFGIRDGASAARVARVSDAVVVGSAVVSKVEVNAESPDALPGILAAFIGELRSAMDAVVP
jgi:tryptophan synthase alpha chain